MSPPCHRFAEALTLLAAGALEGAERTRVEAHAQGCPSCAAEVDAERTLLTELAADVARLPAEREERFAARVRVALAAERQRSSPDVPAGRARRWPAWLAGAVVGGAIGAAALAVRSPPAPADGGDVAAAPAEETEDPELLADAWLEDPLVDAAPLEVARLARALGADDEPEDLEDLSDEELERLAELLPPG